MYRPKSTRGLAAPYKDSSHRAGASFAASDSEPRLKSALDSLVPVTTKIEGALLPFGCRSTTLATCMRPGVAGLLPVDCFCTVGLVGANLARVEVGAYGTRGGGKLTKLKQAVPAIDSDGDDQRQRSDVDITSGRDQSPGNPAATRMWTPGGRRPVDRERRRDPAAWHRHEQAETGVAPPTCLERRQERRTASPPVRVASLWSEEDGEE